MLHLGCDFRMGLQDSTAMPPMTAKQLSVPYIYHILSLCCACFRVLLTHTGREEYYLVELMEVRIT